MAKQGSGRDSRASGNWLGQGLETGAPVDLTQAAAGFRLQFVESLLSGDRSTSFVKV